MTVARDFILQVVHDPKEIVRCRSPQQKPFLRVHFDNGVTVELPYAMITRLFDEMDIARTMYELHTAPVIPLRKNKPRKET